MVVSFIGPFFFFSFLIIISVELISKAVSLYFLFLCLQRQQGGFFIFVLSPFIIIISAEGGDFAFFSPISWGSVKKNGVESVAVKLAEVI